MEMSNSGQNRSASPQISVVISTRDRGDAVVPTVMSVLRNATPVFELIVVDQSANEQTATALRPHLDDARLHLIRSPSRGLSAGRNHGIAEARAGIIACTDDDCEVSPNWLQHLQDAFASHTEAALVFGNILPGPHDHSAGSIMSYVRRDDFLARGMRQKHRVEGTAGCMGLRRSVWQCLHGFDEHLGAGTSFHAAEEMDLMVRVLMAGYAIYETPTVVVVHHGFRPWDQGQQQIAGYLYGIGAMFAKHIKCGNWSIIYYLLHLFDRWTRRQPVVDFGHRPSRWLRLRAFGFGILAGFRHPVNRTHNLYARTSTANGDAQSFKK